MGHRGKGYRRPSRATRLAPHLFVFCTLAGALPHLVPRVAHAQGKAPTAQARAADLFSAGAEAYRKGDFNRTVALLNEAYALDPQSVVLYNLGRAYEGLGDADKAIDAYERYLAAEPKAPDRPSLEQRIATLKRQREERKTLEQQRDEEKRRAEAAAQEQRRAEERAQQARDADRSHTRSVAPYVVAAVGAAGLVAGGVFGLAASSKHDTAASEHVQATAIEAQDSAKSLGTVSTVSFIAGGVLLATGVTWWVLDGPPKKTQGSRGTTRIGVSPSFVTIGGSF